MKEFETIEMTVARRPSKEAKRYYIMMVLMCAAITVFAVRTLILIPGAVAAWILVAVSWRRLTRDYDYEFYRGDLEIYEVRANGKKRHCRLDINLEKTVKVCHYADFKVAPNLKVKVEDYASGNPDARVYVVAVREQDYVRKIIIEPSDELLEAFQAYAPNKVQL